MPPVQLGPHMVIDAVLVAVIGYTLAISMTQILAKKQGYKIEPTQELYAQVSPSLVPQPPTLQAFA